MSSGQIPGSGILLDIASFPQKEYTNLHSDQQCMSSCSKSHKQNVLHSFVFASLPGEKWKWKLLRSCRTLCYAVDYIIHGIFQVRILEWVAFPFSRGSSQLRDQTQVSCIAGEFFTSWTIREAQEYWSGQPTPSPADLPDPGIEPGSPALQVDFLPTELALSNEWTSLVAQMVKHLPTMRETRVQSLGWEDLLEKEMATHSSILAWKIPWTEELG